MESLIRVADRQGLLKGDLNLVQFSALNWLMGQEVTEHVELEKSRAYLTALAANEYANPHLIRALQEQTVVEEEPVDWVTPESEEDLREILEQFEGLSLD